MAPRLTPEQRSIRARIAAHTRWANTSPEEASRAARERRLAHFEALADPNGQLDPAERRRRAKHLLAAEMQRLALRSAKVRAARRAERNAEAS